MSEQGRHQIILVLLCAVIYFTNLGATHLWDEDEAHFGSTVSEMMSRSNYVVPYFNGEISLHKPAFMYWVMIAGVQVFGNGEFALRVGSAIFSIGTVLLTYHAARMLFTARAGFWSAAALATCLQYMLISRAAVADPELLFFCTLPIVIFIAARRRDHQNASHYIRSAARGDTGISWIRWGMIYGSMGLDCLVKGPVGVVLPTAVLGLFLLFEHADMLSRERMASERSRFKNFMFWLKDVFWPTTILRTTWAMRPLTALAIVGVIAAPWYIAVGLQTDGEWLRGFFFVHNVGRFSSTFENHDGGPLYYLVAICVGMFPWCIFNYQGLRLMATGLGQDSPWRRANLLLISWIAIWITVFSISGTKLPHYVLPAYPAVAMFFGVFIDRWLSGEIQYGRAWMRTSWISLIVVGIAFLVGSRILLKSVLPDETHLMFIGLIPLIGGVIGWWAYEVDRRQTASMTVLATAAAFTLALFAWAAPQVDRYQTSPQIGRWVRDHAMDAPSQISTFGYFDESLVYYTGQQVKPLKKVDQVNEFLANAPGGLLITTSQAIEKLSADLPADVIQLETTPRFLREGQLVLLGRRKVTATAEQPRSAQPRR